MTSPIVHHDENIIELFCDECSADFSIEHEMGIDYIPHFCVFCGHQIYIRDDICFDRVSYWSPHQGRGPAAPAVDRDVDGNHAEINFPAI